MSLDDPRQLSLPGFEAAKARWQQEFAAHAGDAPNPRNRSGIEIKPLYTPEDWGPERYMDDLGFPGQGGMTRGIHASMHRGRTWTQRQLAGLGVPADYNARLKALVESGASAASLIPCNSVYRGYDADEVDPLLLGTCGAVVNTVDDMAVCFDGIPIGEFSTALNDPSPFTLLAFLINVAERRGVPLASLSGTSNQSDYLSHFVCNHMFFRLALPGARRVLVDHIAYAQAKLPSWNPLSVVGQHMQQGGATPAEAMGFTLSSAIQYAEDCRAAGMDPDRFLPTFTFFFDISISFFEEIAKVRAARRIWRRITEERFGARNPKAWRFKFHAQTSGVDLTREQPLNNLARVAVQAMAGIFGGLQSLHTDAFDEVLSVPTEKAARVAIATQEILKREAHLTDVIDPLGGSYYVETLTNAMEAEIEAVIARIDEAGGMYAAVESGLVQRMVGDSALAFQEKVETGEQTIVGVNRFRVPETAGERPEPLRPPPMERIEAQLAELARFRAERDRGAATRGLDALARAADSEDENVFAAVVDAAGAGATHGEICGRLRETLGFGNPLIVP
ncbi:MAG TPA: acyl-CoA mutase large subunit family protein [Thermohalobaculum sp.]|nr:acyl-CoA mutase large subunit family protein [Thermohalobaculum sp.]